MNTSRPPLRINVGFLFNQPRGTFRDITIDLPGIRLLDESATGQLTGTVRISRTSEGLLVQGDFRTHISALCGRCLEDTEQELHTEFTELYVFPNIKNFEQENKEETELVVPDDGYLDLEPLIREYLLLEIPINPLCGPHCKGLCAVCGENLNEISGEHTHENTETLPSSTD